MTKIWQQVCLLEYFSDLFVVEKVSMKKYYSILLYLNIILLVLESLDSSGVYVLQQFSAVVLSVF